MIIIEFILRLRVGHEIEWCKCSLTKYILVCLLCLQYSALHWGEADRRPGLTQHTIRIGILLFCGTGGTGRDGADGTGRGETGRDGTPAEQSTAKVKCRECARSLPSFPVLCVSP